jgi:hypothetical protein
MGFVEQGNGGAAEVEENGMDVEARRSDEQLDETRVAEAAEWAGETATKPLLDDVSRRLFLHRNYSRMDHMGG